MTTCSNDLMRDDASDAAVGHRLHILRSAHNMRQAQIADLLEVDRTSWGRFEKGKRALPLKTALALVRRFDVTLDFLMLGRTDGMPFDRVEHLRQATLLD